MNFRTKIWHILTGWAIPKMNESRLLLAIYSYINILSPFSVQQPRSVTRFLCWSFAIHETSFLNSSSPWLEFFESLFTAISSPSVSLPWKSWLWCFMFIFLCYNFLHFQRVSLVNLSAPEKVLATRPIPWRLIQYLWIKKNLLIQSYASSIQLSCWFYFNSLIAYPLHMVLAL